MNLSDITESLDYVGISFHTYIEYEIKGKGYRTYNIYELKDKLKENEGKDLFGFLEKYLKQIGNKIRFYRFKKWRLLRKWKN
jgi:hypothetical protein